MQEINYQYWLSLKSWNLEEAIMLMSGICPITKPSIEYYNNEIELENARIYNEFEFSDIYLRPFLFGIILSLLFVLKVFT